MRIRHLNNDKIQVTYYGTDFDGDVLFMDEGPGLGEAGILAINDYPDHSESADLCPDNGEGISGNLDSHAKRYHGWRGTTNGIGRYAHGLRSVVAKRETRKTRVVTFGPDMAADKP